MSSQCKVVFERGRFFIETGTARGFGVFYTHNYGIVKYIPFFMLKKIESLINENNKEAAVALWFHACEIADRVPRILFKRLVCVFLHAIAIASLCIFFYFLR